MCGITGYVSRSGSVQAALLEKMCACIRHRGPDDQGIYCSENVGIGIRRLSIIDVAGGHQPVFNEDGMMAIVFNGEIYNYKELKQALCSRGHKFRTRSDTEAIIHQYEDTGRDSVNQFNGMFAFAILDKKRHKLFLARDRMGIKPLYYYFNESKFAFGSEIKCLLEADRDRRINRKAIWDYLTYRYVPGPDTIWEGIHKLPPAHFLELDLENWSLDMERYWDIPYVPDSPFRASEADYVEEFSNLFEDAVRCHLQADVPVGILLSGGLDSSAVLAATSSLHNGSIHSFSVGFAGTEEYSELPYARQASKYACTESHEIVIDHHDFIEFLPDFVWYTDEPLADLASVPLYYVSRLASSDVKVVLSGEGSDEILAGYDLDLFYGELLKARRLGFLPAGLKRVLHRLWPPYVDFRDIPASIPFHMTNIFSYSEKSKLFRGDPQLGDSLDLVREQYRAVKGCHPLNQILYVFSQSWLAEDLLMKADKMTMANSIELRVPFLDYRIVEWAARLPVDLKIGFLNGTGVTKRILRLYCGGRIPDSIVGRPKKGFPVPAYEWLSNQLKGFALDILGQSTRLSDFLDADHIRTVRDQGIVDEASGRARHQLWSLLILELWLQRWWNA